MACEYYEDLHVALAERGTVVRPVDTFHRGDISVERGTFNSIVALRTLAALEDIAEHLRWIAHCTQDD